MQTSLKTKHWDKQKSVATFNCTLFSRLIYFDLYWSPFIEHWLYAKHCVKCVPFLLIQCSQEHTLEQKGVLLGLLTRGGNWGSESEWLAQEGVVNWQSSLSHHVTSLYEDPYLSFHRLCWRRTSIYPLRPQTLGRRECIHLSLHPKHNTRVWHRIDTLEA
jgi:hypothetical protein